MDLNKNLIIDEIKDFDDIPENKQIQKIREMKNELQKSIKENEKQEDPDNILYTNIERANKLLDLLEEKINNNDKKKESVSRMFEVSAQLINAITTATSSIVGGQKDELDYQYKLEQLELEHKKLAIKYAMGGGDKQGSKSGSVTNNNLIVSSREDLLRMMKESEEEGE